MAAPVRAPLARLVQAGLLTSAADGLFSTVLASAFYGSTAARLWQGVAAAVLGPGALAGGRGAVAAGLALHVGVAFAWSAAFLALALASPWVRARLAARGGVAAAAAVYGPAVWLVMSLVVLPVLRRQPPAITARWWVQFAGHAVFVGLPIAWAVSRGVRAPDPRDARSPRTATA